MAATTTTMNGNGTHPKMNGSDNHDDDEPLHPYSIKVSAKFVVTSLLASMLLAFAVGQAARLLLLEGPRNAFLEQQRASGLSLQDQGHANNAQPLPSLTIQSGKKLPKSRYTSRISDTSMSASSSSWLNTERDANNLEGGDARQCQDGKEECTAMEEEEEEENGDREENPSGEHLMVDIKHVSGAFLNSEQRLAQAMVDLVNELDLTLMSYHCHGLTPAGVSCVGVLKQNYVSFHTWPVEGVITFDLCVGGTTPLLPALPAIKRLFGVPRAAGEESVTMEVPEMRWAHKFRGFRPRPDSYTSLFGITDLGQYILEELNSVMKEKVATVKTAFQRIDIYDVIDAQEEFEMYKKSLVPDDSYHSRNPIFYRPDRIVMLDGWLQSTREDEIAYHEALVHPALFAHPEPKRVAIIGGGEAATLREVLKHKSVEDAVMIEIDEMMVKASREYLPEWSNCTDFGAEWCVEDPRADMHYEDALAWFMDRYPHNKEAKEKLMDVVIMDALDPESDVPFAQVLYGNDAVMQSFYDSLSPNGILVMQLGESAETDDPEEILTSAKNRAKTTDLLTRVGFQSIHAYEESHCGFRAPWTFLVAFKSYETRSRWYYTAAEVDLEVVKRRIPTKSGTNPFKYFDGPTMVSYQVPPKAMEIVYCRQEPMPEECEDGYYTFDVEEPNIRIDSFEVKMSEEGEHVGRGVFTKVDIPEDAYLSAETSCQHLRFMPETKELIEKMVKRFSDASIVPVNAYMTGYGFSTRLLGEPDTVVDSSIMTFVNHGCRGEYNIGLDSEFDEFTVDPKIMPAEFNVKKDAKFSPIADRHLFHYAVPALEDIPAGDEILDNYLAFIGDGDDWEEDVADLRNECSGALGEVREYERQREQ